VLGRDAPDHRGRAYPQARLAALFAGRASGSATASAASVSILAIVVPISTVWLSIARISTRMPEVGAGMSASTLSVEISRIDSSRLTSSPTFLSHFVMVPSAIDSPIWGMMTSTLAITQPL
jgi:hypothetical protein